MVSKARRSATKCPTEAQEQEQLCKWLTAKNVNYFAVPNGGKRHKRTAQSLKRQGVKAGIPDLLIIDHPMMEIDGEMVRMVGVALELKRQSLRPKEKVADLRDQPFQGASEVQRWWLNKFSERGWLSFVAYGALDAMLKLVSCGVIPVDRFNDEEKMLLNRLGAQLLGEYELENSTHEVDLSSPDQMEGAQLEQEGQNTQTESASDRLEDEADTLQ